MARSVKEHLALDEELTEPERIPAPVAEASPPEDTEPERPEWLPDKFKAPEELARSYGELEGKLGDQGKTITDLQTQLSEMQAQPQQDLGYQDPYTDQDYLAQLYEENPIEATRLVLQQQLGEMQQRAQQAQQQQQQQQAPMYAAQQATQAEMIADVTSRHMEQRYDDFEQYRGRAQELLQERNIPPEELMSLPDFERHVDEAYRLAKYETLAGQEQELRQAGVSQEEIDVMRKQQAQTLTGRSVAREQLSPSEEQAQSIVEAYKSKTMPWHR